MLPPNPRVMGVHEQSAGSQRSPGGLRLRSRGRQSRRTEADSVAHPVNRRLRGKEPVRRIGKDLVAMNELDEEEPFTVLDFNGCRFNDRQTFRNRPESLKRAERFAQVVQNTEKQRDVVVPRAPRSQSIKSSVTLSTALPKAACTRSKLRLPGKARESQYLHSGPQASCGSLRCWHAPT